MWATIKHFLPSLLFVAALAFGGWILLNKKVVENPTNDGSFGADFFTVNATNLIGAASTTPLGLSGNLTPNPGRVYVSKGCDKVIIAGSYLPREANAYAIILVEGSVDNGAVYFPLSARVAGTVEVDVYADGGTGMGAATSGIPFIFPGDKTTTAGQGVTSTIIELEDVAFTHLRVSAREQFTASTGTLWMQAACAR